MNDSIKTIRTTRIPPNWVSTFLGLSLCMAGSLMGVLASSSTAAEPFAPAGQVDVWTLDFVPSKFDLYSDPIDGESYYYLTYQVFNRTGKGRMFSPQIELMTLKGEVLRSGTGVSTEVTNRLMGLLSQPLLQNEYQVIGNIREGKENAVDGIVIWKATDLPSPLKDNDFPPDTDLNSHEDIDSTNDIAIFVSGLSNGLKKYKNPLTHEEVLMRKTLRLGYVLPGDRIGAAPVPDHLLGHKEDGTSQQLYLNYRGYYLPHAKIRNGLWTYR